ncbi:MAG: hypothetical protein R2708_15675 [Vicinamibacterales bacterium]
MAKDLSKDDLRRFARLGAMRRLEDIRKEEAAIRAAFPELFAGEGRRPAGRTARRAAAARPAMSDAARKAVSARMKKYWAARRKAKAAAKNG